MPNWVFNSLVVSGEKSELDKMVAQLNQPLVKHFPEHKFENNEIVWVADEQHYDNPVFAFWNIVKPTDLEAYYEKDTFKGNKNMNLKVDIQEVKNMEESAAIMAQNIADQLEKRLPFRKAMKSALEQVMKNKNIKGVKIEMSGRLGGAEIARTEWYKEGSVPLHTLRCNIDYATAKAHTTYGVIGVKVWINKGFVEKKKIQTI